MSKKKNKTTSFESSLLHLCPDDIAEETEEQRTEAKQEKRGIIIRRILLLFFCVVAAVSLWQIVSTLLQYKKAEDIYGKLNSDIYASDTAGSYSVQDTAILPYGYANMTVEDTGMTQSSIEKIKIKISSLTDINPDIYGWITVPGSDISYPILQSDDNDYYLTHDYMRHYLQAGSIFTDWRCDRDINGNHNTVIYGHNMQNGMMFSDLISFLNEDYFKENKYVNIYTLKGAFTYEIFSVFKADYASDYNRTAFETHTNFIEFAEQMRANSMYYRDGITFNENSRIVTLSTCTNLRWNDRYAVMAVLVDAYNWG